MKKVLALIISFFLLSVLGCATTGQDASQTAESAPEEAAAAPGDFDLSGTWAMSEAIKGCGKNETDTSTVEITQDGGTVSVVNKAKEDWKWVGNVSGYTISVPAKPTNVVSIDKYKLMVSEDANTFTGKIKWDWKKECFGTSTVTYQRQ
ncbi:MAG: hypothetical protein JRH03_10150 [Deltaproteobacteria bacterium]|nr:hypothetical protein [Deltaproteobacteria bacterium]